MNTQLAPPSLTALHDALTIARLALNPKAAAEYLDALTAVTERNEVAMHAVNSTARDLERKASELKSWEGRLAAQEKGLKEREEKLTAGESALASAKQGHEDEVRQAETKLRDTQAFVARSTEAIEQRRRDFETMVTVRTGDLDARDRALREREETHAAKVAKLKELAA